MSDTNNLIFATIQSDSNVSRGKSKYAKISMSLSPMAMIAKAHLKSARSAVTKSSNKVLRANDEVKKWEKALADATHAESLRVFATSPSVSVNDIETTTDEISTDEEKSTTETILRDNITTETDGVVFIEPSTETPPVSVKALETTTEKIAANTVLYDCDYSDSEDDIPDNLEEKNTTETIPCDNTTMETDGVVFMETSTETQFEYPNNETLRT
jgi:hypothetical protein